MSLSLIICPLCQGKCDRLWSQKVWHLPFSGAEFRLAKCDRCDVIFSWPRPDAAQLKVFYETYFDFNWYRERLLLKKVQAWHRWQRVRRLVENSFHGRKRLLDIGCGHGLFLLWPKQLRWDAIGIDYASSATDYAKNELGLNIVESDGDLLNISEKSIGQFDLITM